MDLLLWRHAHARDPEPGETDMNRPLTPKGIRQAENMARWLKRNLPPNTLKLCSPALRTIQTMELLSKDYQLCEYIKPDSSVESLIAASHWPSAPTAVLLVSHQPLLSEAVCQLLGWPLDFTLPFRKGAVWWIRSLHSAPVPDVQLLTVQDPEVL